jgi:hypothetical protein
MWIRDLKIGRVDSSGCEKSWRSRTRKECEEENIKEEGLLYISFSIYIYMCVCVTFGISEKDIRSGRPARHHLRWRLNVARTRKPVICTALYQRKEKQQQLVQHIIRPIQSPATLAVAVVYNCTCNNVIIHSRKSNCWMRFTAWWWWWMTFLYRPGRTTDIYIYLYRSTKTL